MRINAKKMQNVQGSAAIATRGPSKVTAFVSSSAAVTVSLVSRDGETIPLDELPKGGNFVSYEIDGFDLYFHSKGDLWLQSNATVSLGEYNDGIPLQEAVSAKPSPSRQEEIRRIIARTLKAVGATPDANDLETLERDLEFDFYGGGDVLEFGTEMLEDEFLDIADDERAAHRQQPQTQGSEAADDGPKEQKPPSEGSGSEPEGDT